MIYAIEALGSNCIKFGIAKRVGYRQRVLQTGSPYELAVRAIADWPDSAEQRIHDFLAADHVRGEWFRDGDKALEVIRHMNTSTYAEFDAMLISGMPRRLRHHLASVPRG